MDTVNANATNTAKIRHEPFHAILAVLPIPPSYVLLHFAEGTYRLVDIAPYVAGTGPLFTPLHEWDFFRRVRVDTDGAAIIWPNGFDLDPSDLYVVGQAVDPAVLVSAGHRS